MHSKSQTVQSFGDRNPHFGSVENGPYILGHLFRELPPLGEPISDDTALQMHAASQHAENGITTLMSGLEVIGIMMVQVGISKEGSLDSENVTNLGELIRYMAVELKFLREFEGSIDYRLQKAQQISHKEQQ